ncbi:hypothetical protein OIU79_007292 [Salix purpurea]|uniref:Uncharacterized protein n=1 Tax=Salix purpurea TaxID=77065 RepID=A0A9Q0TXJ6_SALPP|nr:hypothetical protein OIU79_007292 [Salix purpurea]
MTHKNHSPYDPGQNYHFSHNMEEEVEDLLPCPRATLACLALPPQRRRRRFLEKVPRPSLHTSLEQSSGTLHCGYGGSARQPTELPEALNNSAASFAALLISFASFETGTGNLKRESAKLKASDLPLSAKAATSWARAAISAVGYVPNHIRDFLFGSRISHTHLLPFRFLVPLKTGCRVSLNILRPARFFGQLVASNTSSSDWTVTRELLLSEDGDGSCQSVDMEFDLDEVDPRNGRK